MVLNSFELVAGRILGNQERVVLDFVSKFEWVRSSGHFRQASGARHCFFVFKSLCFFFSLFLLALLSLARRRV